MHIGAGITLLGSGENVSRLLKVSVFTAVAGFAATVPALSQDNDDDFSRTRNTSVRDRVRPDYDAVGIPVSAFLLFPNLDLTTEYDDNILATQTNPKDDVIFLIEPQATLKSQWSRHELTLSSYALVNQYASNKSENTTDYGAKLDGRLDVYHWTTVTGNFSYDHLTEARDSENTTLNTVSPVQYDLMRSELSGNQQFDFFKFTLTGDYTNYQYQDGKDATGNIVLEQNRNLTSWDETGRLDYALTPDKAIYVSGTLSQNSYELVPPVVAQNRDSTGFTLLGGFNFDLTNLVTGDIGLGYFEQNFDHLAGQNASGFAVNGDVKWFPTQLTTVSLHLARQMQNAVVGISAGYISTDTVLQIDHELRRNIVLTAIGSYNDDAYQGIDRTDHRWTAGVSATYLLNRTFGLTLGYTHGTQRSYGVNRYVNYDDNKWTISLVAQR